MEAERYDTARCLMMNNHDGMGTRDGGRFVTTTWWIISSTENTLSTEQLDWTAVLEQPNRLPDHGEGTCLSSVSTNAKYAAHTLLRPASSHTPQHHCPGPYVELSFPAPAWFCTALMKGCIPIHGPSWPPLLPLAAHLEELLKIRRKMAVIKHSTRLSQY